MNFFYDVLQPAVATGAEALILVPAVYFGFVGVVDFALLTITQLPASANLLHSPAARDASASTWPSTAGFGARGPAAITVCCICLLW